MDVKSTKALQQLQKAVTALLPQSVSGATQSSKSRLDDSYFDTQSLSDVGCETDEKGEKGKGMVRLHAQGCGKESMGISQVHPLLAELGFTADEISTLLRDELIQSRDHGRHEGSLADWKHLYTTTGPTAFGSTTAVDVPFARITGGTTVSTRTTATIGIRKARIKLWINRTPKAVSTSVDEVPILQIVIYRDKIPTSPGTAPTAWQVDANPPASGTALFSQLGANTSSGAATAIRNPITEDAYHIYEVRAHELQMSNGYVTQTAGGFGNAPPHKWLFHFDVDLNDVQQKYSSYAATAPDINDLYFTFRVTNYSATNSFTDTYYVVTDCEFRDQQL